VEHESVSLLFTFVSVHAADPRFLLAAVRSPLDHDISGDERLHGLFSCYFNVPIMNSSAQNVVVDQAQTGIRSCFRARSSPSQTIEMFASNSSKYAYYMRASLLDAARSRVTTMSNCAIPLSMLSIY
jgi:hypothetical protein